VPLFVAITWAKMCPPPFFFFLLLKEEHAIANRENRVAVAAWQWPSNTHGSCRLVQAWAVGDSCELLAHLIKPLGSQSWKFYAYSHLFVQLCCHSTWGFLPTQLFWVASYYSDIQKLLVLALVFKKKNHPPTPPPHHPKKKLVPVRKKNAGRLW